MQEYDTDAFDVYYEHLILWDRHNATVRKLSNGIWIRNNAKHGHGRFLYPAIVPFWPRNWHPPLRQSMEIGRSFMLKEYQQNLQHCCDALDQNCKWRHERQNINYIFWCGEHQQSIFQPKKSLIINMLSRHFKDPQIARHINPKQFWNEMSKMGDSLWRITMKRISDNTIFFVRSWKQCQGNPQY